MTTATALRRPAEHEEKFMMLNVRLPGGLPRTVPALDGMTLMEILRADAIPIVAECGGAAVCATCHVRVSPAWASAISPPSDDELAKLDEIPGADNASRLACQVVMTPDLDGLEIDLQADSLRTPHNNSES